VPAHELVPTVAGVGAWWRSGVPRLLERALVRILARALESASSEKEVEEGCGSGCWQRGHWHRPQEPTATALLMAPPTGAQEHLTRVHRPAISRWPRHLLPPHEPALRARMAGLHLMQAQASHQPRRQSQLPNRARWQGQRLKAGWGKSPHVARGYPQACMQRIQKSMWMWYNGARW